MAEKLASQDPSNIDLKGMEWYQFNRKIHE